MLSSSTTPAHSLLQPLGPARPDPARGGRQRRAREPGRGDASHHRLAHRLRPGLGGCAQLGPDRPGLRRSARRLARTRPRRRRGAAPGRARRHTVAGHARTRRRRRGAEQGLGRPPGRQRQPVVDMSLRSGGVALRLDRPALAARFRARRQAAGAGAWPVPERPAMDTPRPRPARRWRATAASRRCTYTTTAAGMSRRTAATSPRCCSSCCRPGRCRWTNW